MGQSGQNWCEMCKWASRRTNSEAIAYAQGLEVQRRARYCPILDSGNLVHEISE